MTAQPGCSAKKVLAWVFGFWMLGPAVPAVWAADAPLRSPNSPTPPQPTEPSEPRATRLFELKEPLAEETRIVILGTFGTIDAHHFKVSAGPGKRSLRVTGRPEALRYLASLIAAMDRPSRESDIQRRLYEMWVRMNQTMPDAGAGR